MNSRDIVLMMAVFVLCFFVSEMVITNLVTESILVRFALRITFLVQYGILIGFLFRIDGED